MQEHLDILPEDAYLLLKDEIMRKLAAHFEAAFEKEAGRFDNIPSMAGMSQAADARNANYLGRSHFTENKPLHTTKSDLNTLKPPMARTTQFNQVKPSMSGIGGEVRTSMPGTSGLKMPAAPKAPTGGGGIGSSVNRPGGGGHDFMLRPGGGGGRALHKPGAR